MARSTDVSGIQYTCFGRKFKCFGNQFKSLKGLEVMDFQLSDVKIGYQKYVSTLLYMWSLEVPVEQY